jgi:hypothetical protein
MTLLGPDSPLLAPWAPMLSPDSVIVGDNPNDQPGLDVGREVVVLDAQAATVLDAGQARVTVDDGEALPMDADEERL